MSKFVSFLKSIFVSDPGKKIRKQLDVKYKQAVEFQRNGKLREYGQTMKEIEDLEKQYEEVASEQANL
ncbi:MAG: DUF6435 family protein [Actinomycetota bacterium]|nr:DUF6435 family protein [Actinomycetota bacterium]MEC8392310.1 DUF6435 family protein [Actinomycetota bacterium]